MPVSDQKFNNIKIHTQYSICEGAIKIDELAEYCKSNKVKSIGLADSYNLCGALEFSEKLSKVGTQPIIGTQINLSANNIKGKITLYATSGEIPTLTSNDVAPTLEIGNHCLLAGSVGRGYA